MHKARLIGTISNAVSKALGKEGHFYKPGERIYLGDRNIKHMKQRHLLVYIKYNDRLSQIIAEPDYVGINDEDGSLMYVKLFEDHVKLVVRVAGDEKLYIRTMYTVYKSRTEDSVKSGKLKPLTKES